MKRQLIIYSCLALLFFSCANQLNVNDRESANDQPSELSAKPSSTTDEARQNKIRYNDHIYKKNIRTAQLYVKDQPLSFPVIFLNDNKQLQLHFDDLDQEFHTYSYEFVHCNANWQPSALNPQEYIQGFFQGFIEDYNYSFNTLFQYIHYQLEFPNREIKFIKSGNYVLKVYANNDPDDLILTRRFFVVEKKISVTPRIKIATLARHRDYKQEVDLMIDLKNYQVQDPYADLSVFIMQNRRWDNAISNLKPLFVKGNELIYNYEDKNLFDGGNEFRFFDTKDFLYQAMNVDGIQIINGKNHVWVIPDEPRSFRRYYFQNDINGQRLIKRDNSQNSNKEADYMYTNFTLKRESPLLGGDVYVFGELSEWEFKDDFKMEYVEIEKEYRLKTILKQGYYNYMYAFLPEGKTEGDLSMIEGTHSEAENNYYILVYHRNQGEIYDRIVGFALQNSNAPQPNIPQN